MRLSFLSTGTEAGVPAGVDCVRDGRRALPEAPDLTPIVGAERGSAV